MCRSKARIRALTLRLKLSPSGTVQDVLWITSGLMERDRSVFNLEAHLRRAISRRIRKSQTACSRASHRKILRWLTAEILRSREIDLSRLVKQADPAIRT